MNDRPENNDSLPFVVTILLLSSSGMPPIQLTIQSVDHIKKTEDTFRIVKTDGNYLEFFKDKLIFLETTDIQI